MINIVKDKKGDSFILTQTNRIEGIDFHKQMNLTREEVIDLYEMLETIISNYMVTKIKITHA